MRDIAVVVLAWSVLFVAGCGAAVPSLPGEPPPQIATQTATMPPTMEDTETLTTEVASPTPKPSNTPTLSPTLTKPAAETKTSTPTPVQEPAAGEPQLKMVLIRAKSPLEVQELRRMQLDIVRITPVESDQTPTSKEDFLKREFIIEAVIPSGILTKLTAMGFEVTEVP